MTQTTELLYGKEAMDKLKKYFIYILLLVGFFILSNFLINVGLNSTYKKITRKETEALLNIGTTKAYRILKELSSAGKLHINGSGKNVYYTGE